MAGRSRPLAFGDRRWNREGVHHAGLLPLNGLIGSGERGAKLAKEVKSGSPHHRFVIALHSPEAFVETGLPKQAPEKNRDIDVAQW